MSLKYNKKLIPLAKKLRKEATKQENHLWYDFLSRYPVPFQRQKVIDNYIVDFYCHAAQLAIELDGGQHLTEDIGRNDVWRTGMLKLQDLKVMRILNSEIDQHFDEVCRSIDAIVKERIAGRDIKS